MTMKEKLAACARNGKALLAVNFYNFETLKGLLLAAKATNSSLILQLSEGTLEYLGMEPSVAGSPTRSLSLPTPSLCPHQSARAASTSGRLS